VQVEGFLLRHAAGGAHAVDAAAGFVPVVDGTNVAEAGVVPVGHVKAAVRTGAGPNGAEPAVGRADEVLPILGADGGAIGNAFADINFVSQRVGGDDVAFIGGAEEAAFVDGEGLREALGVALMLHVLKPAEGVGIGERAVFAPAFDAVAALLIVHATGGATVGAGEDAALAVDVQAEGIAAAFGVDFEDLAAGMVAPDALAFPLHVFGGGAADIAGGGAAVGAVEPAVHAPLQAGGDAVGVLQAEATERDFGIAVRKAVVIGIRIAEEVRRIEHPDAAAAGDGGAGDVEAGDDVGVLVEGAVAIRVFEDGDLVRTLFTARRGQGDLVELGAQVLVVTDDFQSGGELVLAILRDP
jgi:hypothetical protein